MSEELELRILQAVHEPDTVDLELLAHEIAGSDDAQAYLIRLIDTISTLSPASQPAARAGELLEHALVIAADQLEGGQQAARTQTEESKRRT